MRKSLALPLLAVLLAPVGAPPAANAEGVSVEHAWSRPALAGRVGVAYLAITDTGTPDRLTGVSSPIAKRVELHETVDENGVKKMRPVSSIAIGPEKPVLFAPGGYHVMLTGLTQALKPGQTFPLTLTFEHAGAVTVDVNVEAAPHGSSGMPGMGNMPGMTH